MRNFRWTPLVLVIAGIASGSVNLWVSESETKALLGLPREIFYIQEGIVNQYAMNFTIVIPANISELHFNWESTARKPVRYKIGVEVSEPSVVRDINFNVPMHGSVPRDPSILTASVPCLHLANGASDVLVTITFNMPRDVDLGLKRSKATLTFRRKRVCRSEAPPTESRDHFQVARPTNDRAQQDGPSSGIVPSLDEAEEAVDSSVGGGEKQVAAGGTTGALYIAVGCTCGVVLVIMIVLSVVLSRNRAIKLHKRTHSVPYDDYDPAEQYRQMAAPSMYSCQSLRSLHQYASLRPLPALPSSSSQSTVTTPLSLAPCQPIAVDRPAGRLAAATSVRSLDQHHLFDLMVDRRRIQPDRCLVEGSFAKIVSGWMSDLDRDEKERILIKSVTDRAATAQISSLLQEGLVYYGLRHKNLLTPLGVTLEEGRPPLLLYPHMKHWNLKKYLQSCAYGTRSASHQLTTPDMIDMSEQVCQGLAYLHQQGIYHGDVAARNCCTDDSLHVKLTDSALSRDLFPEDYCCLGDNVNRPINWMSPEAIQGHAQSDRADVWSFAVLLWELTTLAQQPYVDVDPFEMLATLNEGYRLVQPLNCPDVLYSMMSFCWSYEPVERPSTDRIIDYLRGVHKQNRRF